MADSPGVSTGGLRFQHQLLWYALGDYQLYTSPV